MGKLEDNLFDEILNLVKVNSAPGKLISIDALDGGGNTTQAEHLSGYLKRDLGISAVATKEPTDEFAGRAIRAVLQKKEDLSHLPLQLLFGADRGHHLFNGPEKVVEGLNQGVWYVTARYALTSIVWGKAHGVPLSLLLHANAYYPWPNLCLVLLTSVEESLRRLKKRGGERELFEVEESMRRNLETFQLLAQRLPNVVLLDGEGTEQEVFARVKEIVDVSLLLRSNEQ